MDLHYSQTDMPPGFQWQLFHYLMDLHYSQTVSISSAKPIRVSLPYGFTLFSNEQDNIKEGAVFHYLMDLHYSQTVIM